MTHAAVNGPLEVKMGFAVRALEQRFVNKSRTPSPEPAMAK